uniref:ER membrane protein complex subunit 2 n=1 Tax=Plectus sambesii TaxID=2011161 RepID=A0A914VNZ7_9BILA
MEVKDWTSVCFDEGRSTLRHWREDHVRRPEESVELWEHVLSRRPSALGDELWVVYEQVCIAALDCARLDVAAECMNALQKKFPNSHRVLKLQAMRLEAMGRYDDAVGVYDTLTARDEANPSYRKRKVAVLKAQGKRTEAIRELNDYLKKFLNDNEAWLELSNLYLGECEYAKAAHCLEELILAQPHNSLYLQRYADVKYTLGGTDNVEQAKQYFLQAAKINPNNMRALYGLFFVSLFLK